ncbi:4Fe-4S ferredoxin [Desulfuribacillus stibiiarsenatis]|uniref:4Fe-4S ferredoxin n=2 Tax=Desulfuribacillus stibiiarsenatis TaxID=1390249 RepID=A0A1E5L4I4_9FIRM|nr:4Fe-4S ferredoxin [Desulfuribacillus stibiiarsenatis]
MGELIRRGNDRDPVIAKVDTSMSKYGMVIDLDRCIGCNACTIACKQENNTPPEIHYNVVIEKEEGTFPHVRKMFLPRICMQCDKPPCVKVCPVGATRKRNNGIVDIDYATCIGCRYCMTACPYGARSFDFGVNYYKEPTQFESSVYYEYENTYIREKGEAPQNNVRKCHYCSHRLQQGKKPACVTVCLGKARIFGDLNDKDSIISRVVTKSWGLKNNLGTEPRTRYLGERREI